MRIAICDDNSQYIEEIKRRILEMEYQGVEMEIDVFVNQFELLEKAKTEMYHLVYLDIEMEGKNGIEIANELKMLSPTCIIIFVTNYREYVSNAFIVEAFQYLMKPIDDEIFKKEFKRAVKKFKNSNITKVFKVKEGNKTFIINEIISVESYYNSAKLRTTRGVFYTNYVNLCKIRKELMDYDFVRLQAGYLVNLNYVTSIKYREALLISGKNIPISASCYLKVIEKYHNFIDRLK